MPATCTDASALPSPFVSDGISAAGTFPSGAHAGPAEKPFGDEQLPLRWNATRYSPIGRFIAETSNVMPSPRSMTRTLPLTAEPRPRSGATSPGDGPFAASRFVDANIVRIDSHPDSANAIPSTRHARLRTRRNAGACRADGDRSSVCRNAAAPKTAAYALAMTPHATRAPELPAGCVF